jgi:hypothetical protein
MAVQTVGDSPTDTNHPGKKPAGSQSFVAGIKPQSQPPAQRFCSRTSIRKNGRQNKLLE